MLKQKKSKTIVLIISMFIHFGFGQQNQELKSISSTLKSIIKNKYSNQINFKKATVFYLNKNYDSTLVYSQKQLIVNNMTLEINDYCHYFRAICFQNKKLYQEGLNETVKWYVNNKNY